MELLRGRTLRIELSRRGVLTPVTASAWIAQIGGAVAAAHANGVVHRDLKPENVFVTESVSGGDLLKVLDFGIAKILASDAEATAAVTDRGAILGTLRYTSPEQLNRAETSERSDIFSLGVIAAEAIGGRRPFRGRTPAELLLSIERDTLRLGGEDQEWRRLESVLRRAVAYNPSDRPGSVDEYLRQLLPALAALPESAALGDSPTFS
jgi:Serine/threonine protein kinase